MLSRRQRRNLVGIDENEHVECSAVQEPEDLRVLGLRKVVNVEGAHRDIRS